MINDAEVTDVALIIEETVKSFGELFIPDEQRRTEVVDCLVLMVKTAVEEMTPPSTEPEVIIEHAEYCCIIGDEINKNMKLGIIKNLYPFPIKINGKWVCFECAEAMKEQEH